MNQSRLLAQIGLVFTTLAWGVTFYLVQESLPYAKPFTFIFFRFIVATLAVLLFVFLKKDKGFFKKINNDEIKFGIICGFFLCGGYAFQNFGLELTTVNKSAFITSISVLLVPFVLLLYKKEKIKNMLWLSIVIVILGMYLLLDPTATKAQSGANYNQEQISINIGDLFTFFCAVFFAIHIIAQSDAVKNKINIIRFFIIQCLSVSVFAGICALFVNEPSIIWINNKNIFFDKHIVWISLLINGIIATAFAIFIMVWAQRILTAGETAVIFSLEPIFTGIFSHMIGIETLFLSQWFGGIIVVLSVMYYSIFTGKN